MAWEIIKQPDGRFCVYSSIVDHFVYIDQDHDEIKELYKDEWGRRGVEFVDMTLKTLDAGEKPNQNSQSFDEAVEFIKAFHGEFKLVLKNGIVLTDEHFYEIGEKNESQ